MTREELDFIGSMNMCDEISNEAYKKIVCHCEGQEPCENAISRQAAIDYCYQLINVEHQQGSDEMNYGQERVNQTETILHHLEFMPSVRPEQKTGHWIKTPKAVMGEGYMWYCDKCEHQVYQDSSRDYPSEKYCPNCGAKMSEIPTGSESEE